MGHYSGTAYDMRLNTEHPTYQDIVDNLEKEIKQKYIQNDLNPGESFSASMKFNLNNKEKISYCSSGYKNRIDNSLSNSLIRKIEENIKSDDNKYYYYISDSGENAGAIERVHGYAKKVAQYLYDAGYTDYDQLAFYNERGIERFHECLNNKEELAQVIKEGEQKRFKRELRDNIYNVHLPCPMNFYNRAPGGIKSNKWQNWKIDEKILAYFLVYGTENNHYIHLNNYGKQSLTLKEYLFADQYGQYAEKWGTKLLQDLTRCGVEFKDGLDSIEGVFNKYSNTYVSEEATKKLVETWYQENKEEFTEVPKFSKETAYYIKDNYPETFIKFKAKLIELHNRHQENLSVKNVVQIKRKM